MSKELGVTALLATYRREVLNKVEVVRLYVGNFCVAAYRENFLADIDDDKKFIVTSSAIGKGRYVGEFKTTQECQRRCEEILKEFYKQLIGG